MDLRKWTWEEKINILIYQILAFTIHGKILKNQKRIINSFNKNEEFEIPDGSYSISDIQG